ncbi:hypothetical protein ACFXKG_21010 [Streptomyces sp. NPDC059255]|uniref:hypothetical protein n=1 Tax=Streptomyces sp. NPDC059255 TaxID=3346793 RepID=UPI0036918CFE
MSWECPFCAPAWAVAPPQGASYLAGLAVGVHDPDALRHFAADIEQRFTPESEVRASYERRCERFARVRDLDRARNDEAPHP